MKANVGFMRIDDLRRSDFALLAQAGAELATLLEMTYSLGEMSKVNPEAVAVVTEVCWRLEELDETAPDEIAHLVCMYERQVKSMSPIFPLRASIFAISSCANGQALPIP